MNDASTESSTAQKFDPEAFAMNLARAMESGGQALAAYLKPREQGEPKDKPPNELGEVIKTFTTVADYWLSDKTRAAELQMKLGKAYLDLWGSSVRRLAGEEAPPAMREWAVKLEAKPKYVVSSTRKDFPWTNSHHIAGDLGTGVQKLKDATPAGVLLGSGKLATELDRLDLIDEYKFLVHPRIAGHGPTLYQSGLPSTRRLELVSAKPLRSGAVAMHYRRAR
jgi:dihydrofolate reductase